MAADGPPLFLLVIRRQSNLFRQQNIHNKTQQKQRITNTFLFSKSHSTHDMSLRLPQLIAYLVVAVAASVLLCATATSAKLCSATDLPEPYKNESIRGKLRQVAAYTKVNGSRVTVKGAFEVVDGCNFRILNFTFLGGPSDGCRWYGFMGDAKENDVTAMKLSDNIVSSHSKVNSKLYPLTDGKFFFCC